MKGSGFTKRKHSFVKYFFLVFSFGCHIEKTFAVDPLAAKNSHEFAGRVSSNDKPANEAYLKLCAEKNLPNRLVVSDPAKSRANESRLKLAAEIEQIFSRNCTQCHNPQSDSGSSLFSNILNRDELISKAIINFERPEQSRLYKALVDNSMPQEGKPLSTEEKAKVLLWIKEKAPDKEENASNLPEVGFISENDKTLCILKDLKSIPSENRPFIRYFSTTHLYNAGKRRELQDTNVAIARLINSLSWSKNLTLPVKVDELGTLLRIDLRDFDWTPKTWELVLKKNPYGIVQHSNAAQAVYGMSKVQFPEIRADWFVFSASKAPLYHEILQLPGGDGKPGADKEFFKLLSVDQNEEHHPEQHFSVGVRQSGVSNNNRIFSRYPLVEPSNNDLNDSERIRGYLYVSDDFASSEGKQNIFDHPLDATKNGGEYIASISKKNRAGEKMNAQIYLLTNAEGKRLDDVSPELGIVSHKKRIRNGFEVANGVSCFDCHDRNDPGIIIPNGNPLSDHIRKNLGTFANSFAPLNLLGRYKSEEEIKPIFNLDRALYKKFQDETGGKPGIVFDVANAFEDDMDESRVAAELGMPLNEFRSQLLHNKDLTRKLAFDATGVISRNSFLAEFKEIVVAFTLGDFPVQIQDLKTNEPKDKDLKHELEPLQVGRPKLEQSKNEKQVAQLKALQEAEKLALRQKAEVRKLSQQERGDIREIQENIQSNIASYRTNPFLKKHYQEEANDTFDRYKLEWEKLKIKHKRELAEWKIQSEGVDFDFETDFSIYKPAPSAIDGVQTQSESPRGLSESKKKQIDADNAISSTTQSRKSVQLPLQLRQAELNYKDTEGTRLPALSIQSVSRDSAGRISKLTLSSSNYPSQAFSVYRQPGAGAARFTGTANETATEPGKTTVYKGDFTLIINGESLEDLRRVEVSLKQTSQTTTNKLVPISSGSYFQGYRNQLTTLPLSTINLTGTMTP